MHPTLPVGAGLRELADLPVSPIAGFPAAYLGASLQVSRIKLQPCRRASGTGAGFLTLVSHGLFDGGGQWRRVYRSRIFTGSQTVDFRLELIGWSLTMLVVLAAAVLRCNSRRASATAGRHSDARYVRI
jgi:hypothetical protein